MALMEALASGIPCLVSRIRGNIDLEPYGVEYFDLGDQKQLERKLSDILFKVRQDEQPMEIRGSQADIYDLDSSVVERKMEAIYATTFSAATCENNE